VCQNLVCHVVERVSCRRLGNQFCFQNVGDDVGKVNDHFTSVLCVATNTATLNEEF